MSESALIDALLLQKPYFGSALRALQGSAERHRYMGGVIRFLIENQDLDTLNILEVGSWAGASAVTWANALKRSGLKGHVLCIDPWESFIDIKSNCERHYLEMESSLKNGTIFNLFLHNLKTTGAIDVVKYTRGKSEDLMPDLTKGLYSIIYVDGAHHYQGVLEDLDNASELIPEGGIICGDDLELQMDQMEKSVLLKDVENGHDYKEYVKTGIHYHPGVTLAVGETFGTVGEWQGFWAIQKIKGQWIIPDICQFATTMPEHLVPFVALTSNEDPIALEAYNTFKFQDRYVAISKNIGTVDPMERIGNTEIYPLILVSDSREELLSKVAQAEETSLGAHMELVEQTELYNFIKMGRRFFAVSTSLGPVDLKDALCTVHMPPYLLQGDSEEDVRVNVKKYSNRNHVCPVRMK